MAGGGGSPAVCCPLPPLPHGKKRKTLNTSPEQRNLFDDTLLLTLKAPAILSVEGPGPPARSHTGIVGNAMYMNVHVSLAISTTSISVVHVRGERDGDRLSSPRHACQADSDTSLVAVVTLGEDTTTFQVTYSHVCTAGIPYWLEFCGGRQSGQSKPGTDWLVIGGGGRGGTF